MLEVQKFLKEKSLEKLKTDYGVNYSFSEKYPKLVLLKYSQIDSPMAETLVQECRGLILDTQNDFEIVSYPFKKFFNYKETLAAQINLNCANIYEKKKMVHY